MDPNANLVEQEQLLTRRHDTGALTTTEWGRLDELREALSHWLASGGFQPNWLAAPNAATRFDDVRRHA